MSLWDLESASLSFLSLKSILAIMELDIEILAREKLIYFVKLDPVSWSNSGELVSCDFS